MPAIIFTAEPTDLITSVGHGLNTGDGAGSVLNIGGALPGGLSATTDYYWIRVDADHGKLATSVLNAQAGVAVDITSAGSGQHWFGIGLPFRRQRTYAQGVDIKSADLNAMQDCIAGRKFRPDPLIISGNAFALSAGSFVANSPPTQVLGIWSTALTGELSAPLTLPPGTRITEIVWDYSRGTGSIAFKLMRRPFAGAGAAMVPVFTKTVNTGSGWTTAVSSSEAGMPHLTLDAMYYALAVTIDAASGITAQFEGCRVTVDRLL